MDNYLLTFQEILSLRGLTDHTVTYCSTYIGAYLRYLSDHLSKSPEDASWQELREFIKRLQPTHSLSDRTINAVISQLRFFTIYVLHNQWDSPQLPKRRFDEHLHFTPSQPET